MTRSVLFGFLICSALAVFGITPACGADSPTATAEAAKSEGRLPMYYGQLGLDETQRAKVLSAVADFARKLRVLEAQIDALSKERDANVLAVLTPDQKTKLDGLKGNAKAARDAKRMAKKEKATPPAKP